MARHYYTIAELFTQEEIVKAIDVLRASQPCDYNRNLVE